MVKLKLVSTLNFCQVYTGSSRCTKIQAQTRFLLASLILSLKPLAKGRTSIFKVMIYFVQNYSSKCHCFSGVNTIWTVLNKEGVITRINPISRRWQGLVHSWWYLPLQTFYLFILFFYIFLKFEKCGECGSS